MKLYPIKFSDFIYAILILFSIMRSGLSAGIDLEERAQSFVLNTQKISIPGFPNAFNPSIIRWKGSLLLCFRDIPDLKYKYNSEIGLVWLDEKFKPKSKPQLLDIKGKYSIIPARAEDARLILVKDSLYIVYSDNKDEKITRGGFRVYIGEIKLDGDNFSLHNVECLSRYEGESILKREKNWVPFDYHGNLLLAYSISPHLILRPLLQQSGKCETFSFIQQAIPWQWGDLRGGTPGLIVKDSEYLAFFHSSIDMKTVHSNEQVMSHYFMGAYTFSSSPPFEITQVSPEPIIGKGFYHGKMYQPFWKQVRVVFPGGFIFDENYIWVAYGRQDHEIWIVKLNKHELFKSLIPLSTTD